MIKFVTNAFSLNMLGCDVDMSTKKLSVEEARTFAEKAESIVGHADTAAVMSGLLGLTIECRRKTVLIGGSAEVLVGQYRGVRLPEGAKALPEGASIEWVLLSVRSKDGLEVGTFSH